MKTYSVSQIAEMLGKNPETVRRWIRAKKLQAVQTSKKVGNIVSESELQRFLKETPKYVKSISQDILSAQNIGISISLALFLGGAIATIIDKASSKPEDIVNLLQKTLSEIDDSIKKKEITVKQLEQEITKEKEEAENLKNLLNNYAGRKEIT